MFNASLPPALGVKEYKGQVYTMWPHPNHPSLASLFRRCDELHRENPTRAPTIFFIKEGDHEAGGEYLEINYPMRIIGAGRDKTTIRGGGFRFEGKKEEGKVVVLKDMTISETSMSGVVGTDGLSWLCDSMNITQCAECGDKLKYSFK
jgi:hypothetical protein